MVKVNLGLTVYNGERFVREAVDAALDQTLTDFDLIMQSPPSPTASPKG